MGKNLFKKNPRSHRKTEIQRTVELGREFIYKVDRMNKERRTGRIRRNRIKNQVKARINPQSLVRARRTARIARRSAAIARRPALALPPAMLAPPLAVPPIALMPPPAAISAPIPRTLSRTGSLSGANKSGKVTKFKSAVGGDLAIPAFGFIDVCFCVDATGSMSGEVAQVQQVIKSIIDNIQSKVRTEGLQLRFAVVTYRDHPPQDSSYVTKINDFTDNFETIKYVKTLNAGGGGDEPEAVHDGLFDSATKLNWAQVPGTPVLRYIFHIADAPPHGSQFNTYEPRQGCLCGMQTDDILRQINKKCIHYRLIKVRSNPRVDKMGQIFKSKLGDYDQTDISNASQMNVKVSDMIIHEVLPDFA